jgi:hypothetical protein
VLIVTCALALATFAVVQDRVTAAGARHYAAIQRGNVATPGRRVTIEEVMAPAIDRAVLWGAGAASIVIILGLGLVTILPGRLRQSGPSGRLPR